MKKNLNISSISVIKNEEKKITDCINSLIDCVDEIIIIVDDSTTDNTIEIIKKYPQVKFEVVKWKGFSGTKKLALNKTNNDWIFWIDADEVVTEELKNEINEFKASEPEYVAYDIKRKAFFLGRWIKHSGWYPGFTTRLFNKKYVHFDNKNVHEGLIINGKTGRFKKDLLHFTFDTIEQYFEKLNLYTSLRAKTFFEEKKSFSIIQMVLKSVLKFIKMYFLKLGFLDGMEGFLLAFFSGVVIFVERAKLWEQKTKKGTGK